jgi:hypothetical protein
MCLDKLAWTEFGPRCLGPTWTPQSLDEKNLIGSRIA